MNDEIQVGATFHKKRVGKHIAMVEGTPPTAPERPEGRLPRITRYMALAIYYEDLIRQGHVHDYAEIATLGHVTRARVTQIMNLRLLAPDIQEKQSSVDEFTGLIDRLKLIGYLGPNMNYAYGLYLSLGDSQENVVVASAELVECTTVREAKNGIGNVAWKNNR